jgi:hypothetical protein
MNFASSNSVRTIMPRKTESVVSGVVASCHCARRESDEVLGHCGKLRLGKDAAVDLPEVLNPQRATALGSLHEVFTCPTKTSGIL